MRGYQKKVIFLKNTGSPLFDEAYFVISSRCEEKVTKERDMIFEANRIISESLENGDLRIRRERERRKADFLVPFFLGVLISVTLAALVYLFFLI